MPGSELLYILLLTVIPVVLALLITLPFIADSGPGRPDREQARGVAGKRASASALSPRRPERTPPGRADRAA
jgi:hypothetical protein